MVDIGGISGSFVNREQLKKINDTNQVTDEVLDISNLETAKLEIESQDQSKIKYLKVSGGNYVKLDITNPDDISRLISELKNSVNNNPALESSRFLTAFNKTTGIKIDDKYQYTRSEVALNLSSAIDIGEVMTSGDYNNEFKLSERARDSRGFYARVEQNIQKEIDKLETLLNDPNNPPPPEEKAKLEELLALSKEMKQLFTTMKQSHNYRDQVGDVTRVMAQLDNVVAKLKTVNVNDLGSENFARINKVLNEIADISYGFTVIPPTYSKTNKLDFFTLQVFYRIDQITAGNRSRESADIPGALQSFINDKKDMEIFKQQLAELEQKLHNGEFKNQGEYEAAVLKITGNSGNERFNEFGKKYAAFKWESNSARTQLGEADRNRVASAENIQNAYQELQKVQGAITEAAGALQNAQVDLEHEGPPGVSVDTDLIPPEELFNYRQQNIDSARNFVKQAEKSYGVAQSHMQQYEFYKNKGVEFRDLANKHLEAANIALRMADECYNKLKTDGFYEVFKPEIEAQQSQNRQLLQQRDQIKASLDEISANIDILTNSEVEYKKAMGNIEQGITDIGNLVEINQLDLNSDIISSNVRDLHDQVAAMIKAKDDDVDLEDPEEMAEFFEENPDIALKVAASINQMRDEFAALKDKVRRDYANDPAKRDSLLAQVSAMELKVYNTWMATDENMLAGLVTAANNNSALSKKIEQMNTWAMDLQKTNTVNNLKNDQQNKLIAESLHEQIMKTGPMKEGLEEVAGKYGISVNDMQQTPMTILTEDGRTISFNAYTFYDKEEGEYKAYNPLTKSTFTAGSRDGALAELAQEEIVNGRLHYKDTNGGMQDVKVEEPTNTIIMDIGAGAMTLVGGILCFTPLAPVGGAMVAGGSAYFIGKGAVTLYDLGTKEKLGNNAETWGAVIDVGSGVLGVVGGAGALLQGFKGTGQVVLGGTRLATSGNAVLRSTGQLAESTIYGLNLASKSNLAQSLVKLSRARAVIGADIGFMGAGLGYAGHQIYQINTSNMSEGDKNKMTATTIGAIGLPIALSLLARKAITSRQGLQATLKESGAVFDDLKVMVKNLDDLKTQLGAAGKNTDDIAKNLLFLKEELNLRVKDLKNIYQNHEIANMPANKDVQQQALAQIKEMEDLISSIKVDDNVPLAVHQDQQARIKLMDGQMEALGKLDLDAGETGKMHQDFDTMLQEIKGLYETESMAKVPKAERDAVLGRVAELEIKLAKQSMGKQLGGDASLMSKLDNIPDTKIVELNRALQRNANNIDAATFMKNLGSKGSIDETINTFIKLDAKVSQVNNLAMTLKGNDREATLRLRDDMTEMMKAIESGELGIKVRPELTNASGQPAYGSYEDGSITLRNSEDLGAMMHEFKHHQLKGKNSTGTQLLKEEANALQAEAFALRISGEELPSHLRRAMDSYLGGNKNAFEVLAAEIGVHGNTNIKFSSHKFELANYETDSFKVKQTAAIDTKLPEVKSEDGSVTTGVTEREFSIFPPMDQIDLLYQARHDMVKQLDAIIGEGFTLKDGADINTVKNDILEGRISKVEFTDGDNWAVTLKVDADPAGKVSVSKTDVITENGKSETVNSTTNYKTKEFDFNPRTVRVKDKDIKTLQEGGKGTVVTVKSVAEAEALLHAAFPGYKQIDAFGSLTQAEFNRLPDDLKTTLEQRWKRNPMHEMTITKADHALIPEDILQNIKNRWFEEFEPWKNRENVWHTDYNITDHPINGSHGLYPHINVMHKNFNTEIRIVP